MAHEYESGFTVHTPAWHRPETGAKVLEDWPGSWEVAAKEADVTWDITTQKVFVSDPSATLGVKHVPDWQGILRDDTRAVLDIAPSSYHPISNAQFGKVIEDIMEYATGLQLRFDTLVVLREGKVIAATLVGPNRKVPGDPSPIRFQVVAFTSHNRSSSFRIGPSAIRVVCANTQQAAENEMESGTAFTIRHTANWEENVAQAKEGMLVALQVQEKWLEVAREMSANKVSRSQVEEFLQYWIPESSDMQSRQLVNVMARRELFRKLYWDAETTEGIRGTSWGLYQTAVEMCDHFTDSRSWDTEVNRVLLSGDKRKPAALAAIGRL